MQMNGARHPDSLRRCWLAAHRQAGLLAWISAVPALFGGLGPLFWPFLVPVQLLLAAVPAWQVHRRCSTTVLAMAGTQAASGIWLLLDATGWFWLQCGVMLFWIRNGMWGGQPSLTREWLATASNLVFGMLLFLGLGALVGGLQACWGRSGAWRVCWVLASAMALATGFALLFGLPQLMMFLLRLGHMAGPTSPLAYFLLGSLLLLSSWLYWCLRGVITAQLVISKLPA